MAPSENRDDIHWRTAPIGEFCWGIWEDSDEIVLHFTGSGDTYLITLIGYLLLRSLSETPQTENELISSLNTSPEVPSTLLPIPIELIQSHLFYFQKLGIVET